jgi:hypothetical protein
MLINDKRRQLFRRLRFFGFGIILGCLVSYVMLIRGKNLSFWMPSQRVLGKLSHSKLKITDTALCKMKCLHINETEIKQLLADGDVNFSESKVHDTKTPIYIIQKDDNKNFRLTVASGDSLATVLNVSNGSVLPDTCKCN